MSLRWLPPLTALRAFEAVGRYGMPRAAQELNVTTAAISHQIRLLESELGVLLFSRTKKGLVLTVKGREYLSRVAGAFDTLHESSRHAKEGDVRKALVVDSLTSFALDFLVPRLHRFTEAHPDIEVEIQALNRWFGRVSFEQTGANVAIRGGGVAGEWPGLHAERLVPETLFPVCSPNLLATLNSPSDLKNHTIINTTIPPEGWVDWLEFAESRGCDVSGVDFSRTLRFDLIHMSMTAAILGMGVDLARAPLTNLALEQGLLAEPFDLRYESKLAYWLICPKPFSKTPEYEAFIGWLRTELERPLPPSRGSRAGTVPQAQTPLSG